MFTVQAAEAPQVGLPQLVKVHRAVLTSLNHRPPASWTTTDRQERSEPEPERQNGADQQIRSSRLTGRHFTEDLKGLSAGRLDGVDPAAAGASQEQLMTVRGRFYKETKKRKKKKDEERSFPNGSVKSVTASGLFWLLPV